MTVKEDVDIPVYSSDQGGQGQGTEVPMAQSVHYQDDAQELPTAHGVPVQPQGPKTVDVIAPTNMAEGYQFNVDSGGTMMRVAVPSGGVGAGQRFAAIILDEHAAGGAARTSSNNPHNIPTGKWRDELCDCCKFGCCNPLLCLACWCSSCALGQVMTRLGLDLCAGPLDGRKQCMSTFRILFIITAIYQIINWGLTIIVDANTTNENDDEAPFTINGNSNSTTEEEYEIIDTVNSIISLVFWIFVLVLTTRTRAYIRDKFHIPGSCFEDCCCSCWCHVCTICQMARHTADYNQYSANCCSDDGLNPGAPDVV